jgi:hypothetical protein
MSAETPFRPLGFWLKLLDRLIEENLDTALRPFSLTRRHWQILNLVAQGPQTVNAVMTELAAFVPEESQQEAILTELISASWVQYKQDELTLAVSAEDRLVPVRAAINQARAQVSIGVSRSNYDTTITTLETMCRNLGWANTTA